MSVFFLSLPGMYVPMFVLVFYAAEIKKSQPLGQPGIAHWNPDRKLYSNEAGKFIHIQSNMLQYNSHSIKHASISLVPYYVWSFGCCTGKSHRTLNTHRFCKWSEFTLHLQCAILINSICIFVSI